MYNMMYFLPPLTASHDWDFGYPHLQTLMSQNNFPWLFSNVVDASWRSEAGASEQADNNEPDERDKQVYGTLPHFVMTVQGVNVGCIGLVEQYVTSLGLSSLTSREWLDTVPAFPDQFEYRDMAAVGHKLSRELREGPEQCELVIAITHCRLPNDIALASALGAVANPDVQSHGVDLLLGGHDHLYYVGHAVSSYEGQPYEHSMDGTQADRNAMLVKSGTDFHDLSELQLELSAPHTGAVRRRTIEALHVRRHSTAPSDPALPALTEMLDGLLTRIQQSTSQAVAYTLAPWDVRAPSVRTAESPIADLIADILLVSLEEAMHRLFPARAQRVTERGERVVDACLICGGSLRGDTVYGSGNITLGHLLEIMPFEDPVVLKEVSGQDIWDALENGFSMYPKQEGRFPQLAGMRVVWDSSREPGHRVLSVDMLHQPIDGGEPPCEMRNYHFQRNSEDEIDSVMVYRQAPQVREPLQLDRKYRLVTRQYMALGNDGYEALTRGRYVMDDENGQLMSTIVRKFLLGASYISRRRSLLGSEAQSQLVQATNGEPADKNHTPKRRRAEPESGYCSPLTDKAVQRARRLSVGQLPSEAPKRPAARRSSSYMMVDQTPGGIRDALVVGASEHHSFYDTASRMGSPGRGTVVDRVPLETEQIDRASRQVPDELAVVLPLTDGRLVDRARPDAGKDQSIQRSKEQSS